MADLTAWQRAFFLWQEMMVFKKFLTALPDIAQLCHKSVMQVIETFMAINAEKRICIHVD